MSIVLDNCAFSTPSILYQTPKSYQLPVKPIKILPRRLFVSHINHTYNKCIFFSVDEPCTLPAAGTANTAETW